MSRFAYSFLAVLISASVLLTGCIQELPSIRKDSAMRTALPVHMIPRIVPAEPFTLQAFERVHKKYTTATLYIEGDGVPYATPTALSTWSTPIDPIALRLAAQDGSQNVVYLARPCHYRGKYEEKDKCPKIFTTDGKFSEPVIEAYNRALDNIKAYHDVTGFDIVGYDGGAAVAALLAVRRDDIVSLRTVAGNLDTRTTSYLNNVTEPVRSYNAIDFADRLASVPQRHFIGRLDQIITPAVYNSYAQAMGPSACNSVTLVDNADHEHGWVEQWKLLRSLPVECTTDTPIVQEPVPFDPTTLDGDKGHRGKYDKIK